MQFNKNKYKKTLNNNLFVDIKVDLKSKETFNAIKN